MAGELEQRIGHRGDAAGSTPTDYGIRLEILASAAERGYTGSATDEEHVVVLPGSEESFHDWVERPLPGWRLRLTPRGRRWRRLGAGLWHEWEEQGRMDVAKPPC